jgi:hypothetical protein
MSGGAARAQHHGQVRGLTAAGHGEPGRAHRAGEETLAAERRAGLARVHFPGGPWTAFPAAMAAGTAPTAAQRGVAAIAPTAAQKRRQPSATWGMSDRPRMGACTRPGSTTSSTGVPCSRRRPA